MTGANWLQAPGAIEQVFLVLVHLVERAEAFAHHTWHVVQAQLMSQACSISMCCPAALRRSRSGGADSRPRDSIRGVAGF